MRKIQIKKLYKIYCIVPFSEYVNGTYPQYKLAIKFKSGEVMVMKSSKLITKIFKRNGFVASPAPSGFILTNKSELNT